MQLRSGENQENNIGAGGTRADSAKGIRESRGRIVAMRKRRRGVSPVCEHRCQNGKRMGYKIFNHFVLWCVEEPRRG